MKLCKNCKKEKRTEKSMLCLDCFKKEYSSISTKSSLYLTAYDEALRIVKEYRFARKVGTV